MTAPSDERLARAALSRLGEPGDLRLCHLAAELGPQRLLAALAEDRPRDDGLRDDVAERLRHLDPAAELARAARQGIRFVVPGDEEWPDGLDDLAGAGALHERGGVPVGLWVRGPLRLDEIAPGLAVVGSRASTTYGDRVAADVAAEASLAGVTVVSGAAFGIDAAAHQGALGARRPTVAVLACGVDKVYPAAHRALLDDVVRTGAVVSEAAPGCAPQRVRFLARNRVIAALARGTVVVEAAARSGALNTATWASALGRVVAGVPGPVTSGSSAGVHERIRNGSMTLVTSGADVLELVGSAGEHLVEPPRAPTTRRDRLTARQRQLLDAVPVSTGVPADSVARVAGVGVLEAASLLRRLETIGLVERDEDGWRLGRAEPA
ncbi:MAG: DNA-protecting protein DprA [Nocardioides sp.]|nr:DNA-protecting protein DprA [Nocardioides sp.]